jgi:TM2 domain-containing membrane protein YozV
MSDNLAMMRYDANRKSILIAYLLWFFLGWFGVHRFYLGRTVSGIVLLLLTLMSMGLAFVFIGYVLMIIPALWFLLDALLIPGMVSRSNNQLAEELGGRPRY